MGKEGQMSELLADGEKMEISILDTRPCIKLLNFMFQIMLIKVICKHIKENSMRPKAIQIHILYFIHGKIFNLNNFTLLKLETKNLSCDRRFSWVKDALHCKTKFNHEHFFL